MHNSNIWLRSRPCVLRAFAMQLDISLYQKSCANTVSWSIGDTCMDARTIHSHQYTLCIVHYSWLRQQDCVNCVLWYKSTYVPLNVYKCVLLLLRLQWLGSKIRAFQALLSRIVFTFHLSDKGKVSERLESEDDRVAGAKRRRIWGNFWKASLGEKNLWEVFSLRHSFS